MAVDFLAPFGTDLMFSSSPDVALLGPVTVDFSFIDSQQELIQRVIRRLLTTPGEWYPFPQYGAGLRRWVNEPLTSQSAFRIRSDIIDQIMQEPDIARVPAPTVVLSTMANGLLVKVQFFTLALQPVSFAFNPLNPDVFTAPVAIST